MTSVQSEEQKKGFEAATFADNEVWGIDILVSSSEDGKVRFLRLRLYYVIALRRTCVV